MKRTTLAIDEETLRKLKLRATQRGMSLARLANQLLRRGLLDDSGSGRSWVFSWPVHDCGGPPRVDPADRDALFDLFDGDEPASSPAEDS